ncbi:MAG: dihydrodipicolinate reductase [Deltaproteobacteria bacterium]|nr:dihydrodipicolinate reductase [Deltaproteobacteria bacterium]MBN2688371.1 dihydrodipicolinate reductase [Deltaproteobacteria bacterium]
MIDQTINVIHYGLGPIGLETAKLVLSKKNLKIVGAVDISKEKAGRDLGAVMGLGRELGIPVTDRAQDLFSAQTADIVIHTAGSRITTIYSQLEEIIEAGINVISSSEELLFPFTANKGLAKDLDRAAREKGVTVLGTGVNPGFIMDALPLFLTGVCQDVKTVRVERFVDAGTRRLPLQQKVGAGLSPDVFREKVSQKLLGHVGLVESLQFVAHYLGISFDRIDEAIDPVVAEKAVSTAYFDLKPGDVLGIKHTVKGFKGAAEIISLDLRMYVGNDDPHDTICIEGNPTISLRIDGGVAGDQATAAILVNSVPGVVAARPGLVTVKDLPAPHFYR